MKYEKGIYTLLIVIVVLAGLSSCRGGSAKKAIDIAKKYSGKVFKSTEKNAQSYMLGIEHQENGLIGMIGYDYIDEDEKTANLFFVLDKGFWHKGIMTIMMGELLRSTIRYTNHSSYEVKIEYNRKNNKVETLMSRFNISNLKVINYDELT